MNNYDNQAVDTQVAQKANTSTGYLPIDEYLSMPYKKTVYQTGDSGDAAFFAEVIEFDGCFAEGRSAEDALKNLDDSIRAYVTVAIKKGIRIPKPLKSMRANGKVLVRMRPTLHAMLVEKAKLEGVSLNQYIVTSILTGMHIS